MDGGGSGCEGYHAAKWAVDMHKMRFAVRWARAGETGSKRSARTQRAPCDPDDQGMEGGVSATG